MKLDDKIIFVTGGANGLGEATVSDLVKRNAKVMILDVNEEEGNKVQQLLHPNVKFMKCDVRSEEEITKAIETADKLWPNRKIGGAINCSGVGMAELTVAANGKPHDLEVFKTVIEINLIGTYNVSRLVAAKIVNSYPRPEKPKVNPNEDNDLIVDSLPGMVNEDRGVIILTSSVSYQDGQKGQSAYAASKGGVASLALPMARDLARYGIRVVAIAPSLFKTNMSENTSPKVRQAILQTTEFPPRLGTPEEFAHLCCSIMGNPMLNGTTIRIDGASRLGKL